MERDLSELQPAGGISQIFSQPRQIKRKIMSTAIDIASHNPHWAIGEDPAILTNIYDDAVNIALWQRPLNSEVQHYVDQLLEQKTLAIKLVASPGKLMEEVKKIFPATLSREGSDLSAKAFYDDIYLILDMFACLFDVAEIGLRINTLERAMCPRFHKDNVEVRPVKRTNLATLSVTH